LRRVREWFENWSGRRESITYLQARTGEKGTVPLHPDLAAHLGALAKQGVAPELRMKLTGHKTEAVHRGYTHHELEKLRAAVEKIPSLNSK